MECPAGFGRMDAPRRADQQRRSDIALQPRHLLADDRLGDAQPLGGPREGAGVDHRGEIGQPVQVHAWFMAEAILIVRQWHTLRLFCWPSIRIPPLPSCGASRLRREMRLARIPHSQAPGDIHVHTESHHENHPRRRRRCRLRSRRAWPCRRRAFLETFSCRRKRLLSRPGADHRRLRGAADRRRFHLFRRPRRGRGDQGDRQDAHHHLCQPVRPGLLFRPQADQGGFSRRHG